MNEFSAHTDDALRLAYTFWHSELEKAQVVEYGVGGDKVRRHDLSEYRKTIQAITAEMNLRGMFTRQRGKRDISFI